MLPNAGEEGAKEGAAAAEGWREDSAQPDEEVPGASALRTDALHHLHSALARPHPRLHLHRPCLGHLGIPW